MTTFLQRDDFAVTARVLGALFYYSPESHETAPLVQALLTDDWQAQWPLDAEALAPVAAMFKTHSEESLPADVYKADAPKADAPKNRVINGIVELPKDQAVQLEPYDTVTVQGFYRSQPEVNDAITKAAKQKSAYAFYIVRQIDANQGGNQRITAFIYKQDAKKRIVQSPDAIPADSEAGRAALAQGGEAAKKVEIPGVATSASPSAEVGRFFETQSSKGGRYTVTLPDGTKVEELNKATAAMMVPFDSVKFTGNYGNMTEISYQVAKRAAKKGAKYYHITRQWQERGNNITISADLYK